MSKKLLFSVIIFLSAVAAGSVFVWKAGAGTEHSSRGFLGSWSSDKTGDTRTSLDSGESWAGVGPISMNSSNCDADGNGLSDGDTTKYACPPLGTTIANYGVHILSTDNNLSGYAWNPNVGWISFNQSDLVGCPQGTCSARKNGNTLEGWARVVSIKDAAAATPSNSGGWEGWIRLNGKADDEWKCSHSTKSGNNYATQSACQADCPNEEWINNQSCITATYYRAPDGCSGATLASGADTIYSSCPAVFSNCWSSSISTPPANINYQQIGTGTKTYLGGSCAAGGFNGSIDNYNFYKRIGVSMSGSSAASDLGRIKSDSSYLYFRNGIDGSGNDTFEQVQLKGFSAENKDIQLGGAYVSGSVGFSQLKIEGKPGKLNFYKNGSASITDSINITSANASGSANISCPAKSGYNFDKITSVQVALNGDKKIDFTTNCQYSSSAGTISVAGNANTKSAGIDIRFVGSGNQIKVFSYNKAEDYGAITLDGCSVSGDVTTDSDDIPIKLVGNGGIIEVWQQLFGWFWFKHPDSLTLSGCSASGEIVTQSHAEDVHFSSSSDKTSIGVTKSCNGNCLITIASTTAANIITESNFAGTITFGDVCTLTNSANPDQICDGDPPVCSGYTSRGCWQQTAGESYGISINATTNALSGYAWSGSMNGSAGELGYIKFDGASIVCDPTGGTDQYFWGTPTCASDAACGTQSSGAQCFKKDSCGEVAIDSGAGSPHCSGTAPTVTCNANCSGGWKEVN